MKLRQPLGFTLIELMITLAVLAILVAIALPSFQATLENRRLSAAADNIYAFISYAKSEAIKKNQSIRFQATVDGTSWCIGVDDDAAAVCDCTANACEVDGVTKNLTSASFTNIRMTATGSIDFDQRGMAVARSYVTQVGADASRDRNVCVNIVGRVVNNGDAACP